MRELGLEPCLPRPWRFSLTEGDGQEHDILDLVHRDFTAAAPGEKMVGDITYIPTWQGWLYLATIIDCHTKAVMAGRLTITTRLRSTSRRSRWPPATIPSPGMLFSIPIVAATTVSLFHPDLGVARHMA